VLRAGWNRDIGVIVLTGAGSRAFGIGGDKAEKKADRVDRGIGILGNGVEDLQSAIRDVPKPVIAKVRGYAVGSANVLVTLCDLADSFSIHIPFALEGFGFCAEGEAAGLVRSGALAPGGRLPLNTSGGMLSESYMQGWNHLVEAVRQLRGEAGPRQVPKGRNAQYLSDVAGKVASLIYSADGA